MEKILVCVVLISFFFISLASATTSVRIADHGTDVRNLTNDLIEEGNLSIYIYDNESGGTPYIFNQTFPGGIVNGSWNVIIVADMEYGEEYWKDYSINGEDLDYSGDERLEFHSPLGYINNASFFNFSMIGSCSNGQSIKQVYENGSVVCEDDTNTQVAGSGYLYNDSTHMYINMTLLNATMDLRDAEDNASWNESYADTKYINKNEEGNLNVNSTSWWSSVTSWLTGWFVNNGGVLEFNETKLNMTIDDRIAAEDTRVAGDGFYLTNDSTTMTFNDTLLNITIDARSDFDTDTHVASDGFYLYNDSATMSFNDTLLNVTIDARISAEDVDTRVTGSGYLYNDSTYMHINDTLLNNTIDDRDDDTTYTGGDGIDVSGTEINATLGISINATEIEANIIDGTELADTITLDENMNINGGYNFSVDGSDLFVDVDNNRVGIGTTTPTNFLDIYTSANTEGLTISDASGVVGRFMSGYGDGTPTFEAGTGRNFSIGITGTGSSEIWMVPSEYTRFDVGGNEVMRVVSGGNVNVVKNVTADYFLGDGSQLSGISGGIWSNSSGDATFTSGRVGIGTDNPDAMLEVLGDVKLGDSFYVNYISGDLGIGTDTPLETLDVHGSIRASDTFVFSDGSTQDIASTPTGFSWHVGSISYEQSKNVSVEVGNVQGLFFEPDGHKMYVVGDDNDDVYQYSLSSSWDVSTATYEGVLDVSGQGDNPQGIFINPDGGKMYIVTNEGDNVEEYNLSVAWNVTSALYVHSFNITAQNTNPHGVFFKSDGIQMYIVGAGGGLEDHVFQYDLSDPWDVTSAVYDQMINISYYEKNPSDLFFKPDGTRMYIVGNQGNSLDEYSLPDPWDISSAVYDHEFNVGAQDDTPTAMFIRPDGTKLYLLGNQNDSVFEYHLGLIMEGKLTIGGVTLEGANSNLWIGGGFSQSLDAESSSGNLIIGFNSGTAMIEAYDNTIIGSYSGVNLEGGMDNTIIGFESGNSIVDEESNIIIGRGLECASGFSNHCLSIGNIIYGALSDDHSRVQMRIGGSEDDVLTPNATLEISGTNGAFLLPRMSTAQRGALTPVNGMMIYNNETDNFQGYEVQSLNSE